MTDERRDHQDEETHEECDDRYQRHLPPDDVYRRNGHIIRFLVQFDESRFQLEVAQSEPHQQSQKYAKNGDVSALRDEDLLNGPVGAPEGF